MMTNTPKTEVASLAHRGEGRKLIAPSAERNLAPISKLILNCAPPQGNALEIASGTGQHIVAFARQSPKVTWHPTEPDSERRDSIDAYAVEAGLPNLRPAQSLDAAKPGWAQDFEPLDFIVLVNLLHLIATSDVQTLIKEAAIALAPQGRFVIYGPFKRNGMLTSDGDVRFHESLQASDPQIGYKNDADVIEYLKAGGLDLVDVIDMPANNLALVSEKLNP